MSIPTHTISYLSSLTQNVCDKININTHTRILLFQSDSKLSSRELSSHFFCRALGPTLREGSVEDRARVRGSKMAYWDLQTQVVASGA